MDGKPIAALDIGSSKTACFIAQFEGERGCSVLGMGHQASRGISHGAVVDMDLAEQAIRSAVDRAERVAGETVEDVIVSVQAGQPRSRIVEIDIDIDGHAVDQDDIDRALEEAIDAFDDESREIIHAFPACYGLDGVFSTKPPIGMFGDRLSLALHVVSALPGPLRNIETVVRRAHLNLQHFVVAPYAAGLASLVDDEITLGAACIDLGGGTSSLAVFAQGAMLHAEIIPFGGIQLTEDIARGLLTPVDHAERLKTLFGAACCHGADEHQTIDVYQLGDTAKDDTGLSQLPRSMMIDIIQPRLEQLFSDIKQKLRDSGFDGVSGRCVVLTGGAAALPGVTDLAQQILEKQVRVGRPRLLPGLAASTTGPEFAACAGLLLHRMEAPPDVIARQTMGMPAQAAGGGLARVGQWFRENF